MNIPGVVFLVLFGVASLTNIFCAYFENEKWRKISKPFCMLFLGIAAIVFAPDKPLIYIGVFLGLIGDIAMIWKNKKTSLLIGTLSFIAGHVLYLVQGILLLTYTIPWYVYLIVVAIILVLIVCLYRIAYKAVGNLGIVGIIYMSFLLVCFSLGIALIINNTSHPITGIFFSVGYLLFFSSDSLIVYTLFVKDIKRRDFYIMLPYLLAQFFIVFGLLVPTIIK